MKYSRYITFCIIGAILWVTVITLAGYFLGNIPWVQHNFEKIVLGIVLVSVLPVLFGVIKNLLGSKK
jgi:membrane-associated protein